MDTVELIGRVIIALTVVVGLIYLIGKKARGGVRRKLRTNKLIDVLGRQALGKGSSVAVVRVAGRAMIIGVTDQNVRMLGELELDEVAAVVAESDPNARRSDGAAPTGTIAVPANAADLDGMLTAADIEALRGDRGRVIRDETCGPARRRTSASLSPPTRADGGLAGSALSPATWRQTINALRELTVRKG